MRKFGLTTGASIILPDHDYTGIYIQNMIDWRETEIPKG